ncbi:MAG: hypothetical protein ACK47B_22095 [Armatimonadota bacterium]
MRSASLPALLLVSLALPAASAAERKAQPVPAAGLPEATSVLRASREYVVGATAETRHAGWTETLAYATLPQELPVRWHVDPGGEAVLLGRDAWRPDAEWRELRRWGRGTGSDERGADVVSLDRPMALRLRARAPKFPRSGIARVSVRARRHTVAVLRGTAGERRRPVILAEGYDPLNQQDWNDVGWAEDATLARIIAEGEQKHGLDTWLLDWGDAGAPLEQQAGDFAEIAEAVRGWNYGRRETVAIGVSMGAVSLRFALASAADRGDDLGVQKYLSINGPHRGAWVNRKLLETLRKQAGDTDEDQPEGDDDGEFWLLRAIDSPAARQLLIGGADHERFYSELRKRGKDGYHPRIPRVAFSNGTLVREGNELAEWVEGGGDVVHRISVRPLWLPLWLTYKKTRREFEYGGYPGELLPASLRRPVRDHKRLLGIFRFDFRARWEAIPTFIPTHSALDFPPDLTITDGRHRYTNWKRSPFPGLYVSQGRNLAHDATEADWIDPRTGRRAPAGANAILHEVLEAFRQPAARTPMGIRPASSARH